MLNTGSLIYSSKPATFISAIFRMPFVTHHRIILVYKIPKSSLKNSSNQSSFIIEDTIYLEVRVRSSKTSYNYDNAMKLFVLKNLVTKNAGKFSVYLII